MSSETVGLVCTSSRSNHTEPNNIDCLIDRRSGKLREEFLRRLEVETKYCNMVEALQENGGLPTHKSVG